MPEVNKALQPIIDALGINQFHRDGGYDSSGTRNIMACVGNHVCPFANYDTTALAKRIEKAIFPNDLHVKVALTGCPNDCCKVRMHDFGIIGMTEPQFDPTRCVSCGMCVRKCKQLSVEALHMENSVLSVTLIAASVAAFVSMPALTVPGRGAKRNISALPY